MGAAPGQTSTFSAPLRAPELDGLRGCAALSVVVFHMTCELFGTRMPWLVNPVTALLADGSLAVSVFFVLSGEALALGAFGGAGPRGLAKLAVKRVPRLSIPILAATLVTVACLRAGLTFNREAAALLGLTDWLKPWLPVDPTLPQIARFAFWDVYWRTPSGSLLMPFLWTMQDELLGSALVFIVVALWFRAKRIDLYLLLTFLAALLCDRSFYMACFVAGIVLARLRTQGAFAPAAISRRVAIGAGAAVAMIGALYSWLSLGGYCYCAPLVAPLLLGAIYLSPPLLRVFRSRACLELGRLSFAVYLVQFPILVSLTSGLVVAAGRAHRLDAPTCLAIAFVSIAATVLTAKAFMPVEHLTAWVGRRLVDLVFARPAPLDLADRPAALSAP